MGAGILRWHQYPKAADMFLDENETARLNNMYSQAPLYAASQSSLSSHYYNLRAAFDPPLTGSGWTVAILDSGIRKTHVGLENKVVYEENFTTSPTVSDVFSHGTGVAYVCAGGRHMAGEESGIAPGVTMMNIKVLDDKGIGSMETLILGMEEVVSLKEDAEAKGLPLTDPMYPRAMNMSLGIEDDGDPDNPVRIAVRAVHEAGIGMFAAAGNAGPAPGTILLPAACEEVVAVGVVQFYPFVIADFSSRGPTKLGLVKPDWVWYGINILTADASSDEAFTVKTGTSFTSPAFAGGAAVGYEAADRLGLITPEYAEWGKPEIEVAMAQVAIKPEGAPREKDNDYGYGQPDGVLIGRALGISLPGIAPTLEETMAPVIQLGALGMMMGAIGSVLRR